MNPQVRAQAAVRLKAEHPVGPALDALEQTAASRARALRAEAMAPPRVEVGARVEAPQELAPPPEVEAPQEMEAPQAVAPPPEVQARQEEERQAQAAFLVRRANTRTP